MVKLFEQIPSAQRETTQAILGELTRSVQQEEATVQHTEPIHLELPGITMVIPGEQTRLAQREEAMGAPAAQIPSGQCAAIERT
jgi:hypothetical protein